MKTAIIMIGLAIGLTACAPAPAPKAPVTAATADIQAGELIIDTLAGGAFGGRAGSLWTEAEIAAYIAKDECSGRTPGALTITRTQTGYRFSGRC